MSNNTKICSICKKYFKGYGNMAYPLTIGICCDKCNIKVIAVRFKQIKKHKENNAKN